MKSDVKKAYDAEMQQAAQAAAPEVWTASELWGDLETRLMQKAETEKALVSGRPGASAE